MSVNTFFAWLESTAVSRWVVESPSVAFGFPGILTLHAIGMAFAAGLAMALDLRLLGIARGIPLAEFRRLLPVFWAGFWLNAVSGVLLMIGYPTKALTNEVFYLKLALIFTGVAILVRLTRRIAAGRGDESEARGMRLWAAASAVCWIGAIFAGRLLAYTFNRMRTLE